MSSLHHEKFKILVEGVESENLPFDEVVSLMASKRLSPADSYFEQESQTWKPLLENPKVMEALKQNLRSSKSQDSVHREEAKGQHLLSNWYILKGENKFGPFQYPEVIKMLQEKIVFEFDFAWRNGFEAWTRIAEISDFQPENIKKLQDSLMPNINNLFFRRKHPRVPYECEVTVHDNVTLWSGKVFELSEGGAGLIMENSLLLPSHKIYMHFKKSHGLPAFNAISEVVSKRYLEGVRKKEDPMHYGVKFVQISKEDFSRLQIYTRRHMENLAA